MKTTFIQIQTTVDSNEAAEKIAKKLVEKNLAACVSIAPKISSIYRWQGKIETAQEWLLIVKTRAQLYDRVEKEIKEIHPYELPEIIALPIIEGSKDYLDWISSETL